MVQTARADVSSSSDRGSPSYKRHWPERSTLYEVVRDNLETLYGAIDEGALDVKVSKHARKEPRLLSRRAPDRPTNSHGARRLAKVAAASALRPQVRANVKARAGMRFARTSMGAPGRRPACSSVRAPSSGANDALRGGARQ